MGAGRVLERSRVPSSSAAMPFRQACCLATSWHEKVPARELAGTSNRATANVRGGSCTKKCPRIWFLHSSSGQIRRVVELCRYICWARGDCVPGLAGPVAVSGPGLRLTLQRKLPGSLGGDGPGSQLCLRRHGGLRGGAVPQRGVFAGGACLENRTWHMCIWFESHRVGSMSPQEMDSPSFPGVRTDLLSFLSFRTFDLLLRSVTQTHIRQRRERNRTERIREDALDRTVYRKEIMEGHLKETDEANWGG